MNIFINPGHSDVDPGAIGYSGTKEAELVASVGMLTQESLLSAGHQVVLLQHDELWEICAAANDSEADIFVSIHANAFVDSRVYGTECFYHADSEAGRSLAECIQYSLLDCLPLRDRGVKTAEFYVLKYTLMPACLVELGFLTNPAEERLLCDQTEEFARALAYGISCYGDDEHEKRTKKLY